MSKQKSSSSSNTGSVAASSSSGGVNNNSSNSTTLSFAALSGIFFSLLLSHYRGPLPYPYTAYQSQEIPQSNIDLLPGGIYEPSTALYDLVLEEYNNNNNKVVENGSNGSSNDNGNGNWLNKVRRLFEGEIEGVESVAIDEWNGGTLIMLDKYGYIHMAFPDNNTSSSNDEQQQKQNPANVEYVLNPKSKWDKLYIGPGRPLGFHLVNDGTQLVVCDSLKGLLLIHLQSRQIEIISNIVNDDGSVINYANDLDIGPISNHIYFTSSTSGVVGYDSNYGYYDTLRSCILNFIRGDISGRLLVYDPKTKQTKTLLDQLFYANGVAVSYDESYVLVVETFGYRVIRLWLKDNEQQNKKAGDIDTFIGQLPGTPDGITRRRKSNDDTNPNTYWISIVSKVSPLTKLAPYPSLRNFLGNVLIPMLPKLASKILGSTAAIMVNHDASVEYVLLDPTSTTLQSISAVTEYNGALFFGSLSGNYVSVYNMDQNLLKSIPKLIMEKEEKEKQEAQAKKESEHSQEEENKIEDGEVAPADVTEKEEDKQPIEQQQQQEETRNETPPPPQPHHHHPQHQHHHEQQQEEQQQRIMNEATRNEQAAE